MTGAITIRNVPEHVRNILAARAAGSGRSLQEYLLAELTDAASRIDELINRVRPHTPTTQIPVADILDAVDADRR